MDKQVMAMMVYIATEYMGDEDTTILSSGVLGRVSGEAVEKFYGMEAVEEFRERVQDHGRDLITELMNQIKDLDK
jgi:hypothetical protein